MRRFYIPPGQIGKEEAVIQGSDAHHLRDVLRLQPSDRVVVFDGTGRQYQAQVVSVSRQKIKVALQAPLHVDDKPVLQLTMAQGYLKDKKMDGLVRQLTELGIDRWVPFLSKRSVPQPDQLRLQGRYRRWRKISLEALKQCGRSRVMEIDPPVTFGEAVTQARAYDFKIIFWEESKTATLTHWVRKTRPANVFVMIGPEGGFDRTEISLAEKEGFKSMGLGPRILRAETATVAAAVVTQFVFGDMG